MARPRLWSYDEVSDELGSRRAYLLLGNGFSIACDPVFKYGSLYEVAVEAGLSKKAQAVFGKLGTNNFEGVMRLLDDAHWVAAEYGYVECETSPMLADVEVVKEALIKAIADSHLDHTGLVPDTKKESALRFLKPYHSIFTTNYDLLLYWVVMYDPDGPEFEDGFRSDDDDSEASHLVFSERLGNKKGLFYLHGALHLYLREGELRKHSWVRSGLPLMELVRSGLSEKQYPVFVAEGSPEKKLAQIQGLSYLWYCLDKLARIESPLVVFGHSFSENDRHIIDAIARNRKIPKLYVGLHGNPNSRSSQAIREAVRRVQAVRRERHRRYPLEVTFYDSNSAHVWDGGMGDDV